MGVQGLWSLLQPTGRPVTLESLEGKVLAVDVSIWLNQMIKGMRDRHGNPVPNAHLLGLFNRVCKLLFYRIRPVFVFDGSVPALKKQTLAARRQRKEEAFDRSSKAAQKLLENYIKQHAVSKVLGEGDKSKPVAVPMPMPRPTTSKEADLYQLPPVPEEDMSTMLDSEISWEDRMAQRQAIFEEYEDVSGVDVESEEFLELPSEIQHEILTELKDHRKKNSWARLDEMPEDASDFSNYQLAKILKQNKLTQKIEDVRKEMNKNSSGDIVLNTSLDLKTDMDVLSQRVVSEDRSHYILIKGLNKNKRSPEEETPAEVTSSGEKLKQPTDPKEEEIDLTWTETEAESLISNETKSVPNNNHDELSDDIQEIKTEKIHSGQIVIDDNDSNDVDLQLVMEGMTEHESDVTIVEKPEGVIKCGLKHEPSTKVKVCDNGGDDDLEMQLMIEESIKMEQNKTKHWDPANDRIPGQSHAQQIPDDNSICDVDLIQVETNRQQDDVSKRELANTGATVVISDEDNSVSDAALEGVITIGDDEGGFFRDDEDGDELMPVSSTSEHQTSSRVIKDEWNTPSTSSALSKFQAAMEQKKTKAQSLEVKSDEKDRQVPETAEAAVPVNTTKPAESPVNIVSDEESCDSDEGFIEITVDPSTTTGEDELFPASIFTEAANQEKAEAPCDSAKNVPDEPEVEEVDSERKEFESAVGMVTTAEDEEISVQEVPEEPSSEKKENEFIGMTQADLEDYQGHLEQEQKELQSQRGHQERLAASVNDQMQLEAQELLRLFGVPFVVSPTEAEAQCAFLDAMNQTEGSITDDSDIWLFGGKRVYRNFFNQNKYVEFYKSDEIENQLILDRGRLICLGLLCGSDYTEGIQGVGPVTGMELMSEFPGDGMDSLENFKKWWDRIQKEAKGKPETKVKAKLRHLEVKESFPSPAVYDAYMNPTVDDSDEPFSWGLPNLDLLRELARERFGWNKSRTDEQLLPVIKQMTKTQTQKHITSFFQTQIDAPLKVTSQRMKRVLNKMRNPGDIGVEDVSDETIENKRKRVKEALASVSGVNVRGKGRSRGGKRNSEGGKSNSEGGESYDEGGKSKSRRGGRGRGQRSRGKKPMTPKERLAAKLGVELKVRSSNVTRAGPKLSESDSDSD